MFVWLWVWFFVSLQVEIVLLGLPIVMRLKYIMTQTLLAIGRHIYVAYGLCGFSIYIQTG